LWFGCLGTEDITVTNALFVFLLGLYLKPALKALRLTFKTPSSSSAPLSERIVQYAASTDSLSFHLLSFFSFLLFFTLLNHHVLSTDQNGTTTYLGSGCWGNIFVPPGHHQLLHPRWALANPTFSGVMLEYTVLPDFHSAMLIRGGLSTRLAILVPSLLMGWSICLLLYFYVLRFT